jgi:hypothetical protein
MRRVLRCDGLLPVVIENNAWRATTPDDIRAMLGWLRDQGDLPADFDVISEGETQPDANGLEKVKPWAEAGCTWWLETRWMVQGSPAEQLAQVRDRVQAGPPRLSD